MGSIDCPETPVSNYHYSLRNDPEESISDGHNEIFIGLGSIHHYKKW